MIAIQETHGDSGDSAALGRIFPSWRFFESTSSSSGGGGTLFAIRRSYASQFALIEHSTLVPGRVHAVSRGDLGTAADLREPPHLSIPAAC